ncbi:hypothetical protein DY000_02036649 [Brassica cretica]|uniref:Dirigent protein n=1 Tax=Brassica cretica TaxID=69181 RepID=A0ABQ7BDB1_BRACR|nr:hypothetical protein DY000_02036649 [Brassica cretica]
MVSEDVFPFLGLMIKSDLVFPFHISDGIITETARALVSRLIYHKSTFPGGGEADGRVVQRGDEIIGTWSEFNLLETIGPSRNGFGIRLVLSTMADFSFYGGDCSELSSVGVLWVWIVEA